MNKNVLYYTLYIPKDDKIEYYSMLYHSLTTLKKYYKNNFDIVVFYKTPSFKGFTFEQYCHLNKFKIVEAFPFVKFIESDYKENDPWMFKWYHFDKLFKMGYEKVLYLDCDVMFFDNIDYFFEKYTDDAVWTLFGMMCDITGPLLGKGGMASGQIMIPKKQFEKIPNLYKEVLKQRKLLSKKAESLYKKNIYTHYQMENAIFFSEQYAGQMAFEQNNVPLDSFDLLRDIVYGTLESGIYSVEIRRDQVFIETQRVILHYLNNYAYVVLPEALHTPKMSEQYRKNALFATKLFTKRYSTRI